MSEQLFSVGPTTEVGPTKDRLTTECLLPPRFSNLDERFYENLPILQNATEQCKITAVTLKVRLSIAIWGSAILGIDKNTDAWQVGIMLSLKHLTLTLPQIEQVVELTEAQNDTGMVTDRPGNFCFVERNGIGVVPVYLNRGHSWDKCAIDIRDSRLWFNGFILLLANWTPPK